MIIYLTKFVVIIKLYMASSKVPEYGLRNLVLLLFGSGLHLVYNSALFICKFNTGTTLPLLYIDDMIITENNIVGIHDLKYFLSHQFEMRDLGPLIYFLDLEISTRLNGYFFFQAKYTYDLLSHFRLIDSKIAPTHFEANIRLIPTNGALLQNAALYH